MAKPILMFISATVLVLLPGIMPVAAYAEEVFTDSQWNQTAASKPAVPDASPVGSSLLAIGGSLLVVIALAVVLGWLVKRLGVKRLIQAKGNYLEVIESVPLGFKRQASLLRIGDIVVVVGVGEHELVTLATLPASTVLREPPAALTPAALKSAALKPVAETSPVPSAMPAPDQAFRVLLNKVIKG